MNNKTAARFLDLARRDREWEYEMLVDSDGGQRGGGGG